MCKKLIEKSCLDFTGILVSKAPMLGNDGAAALVGALGTVLCSTVGGLAVDRKKYAEAKYDMRIMPRRAEVIQVRLLDLVEEDAAVLEPLAKAYFILKENPKRAEFLEEVTLNTCKAPLKMTEYCYEAIDLPKETTDKGSATLIPDISCDALCCRAALKGTGTNVFINTRTLADKNQVVETEAKTDVMLIVYSGIADQIAEEVTHCPQGVK